MERVFSIACVAWIVGILVATLHALLPLSVVIALVVAVSAAWGYREVYVRNQWILRARTHCHPDTIVNYWTESIRIWWSMEMSSRALDWYFLIQPSNGSEPYIGRLDHELKWARLVPTAQYKVLTNTGAALIPGYENLPSEVEKAYLKRIVPGYVKHVQVVA